MAHQVDAANKAWARLRERRARLQVRLDTTDGLKIGPEHNDHDAFAVEMANTFGTTSLDFADQQIGWLAAIARKQDAALPTQRELNSTIAAVNGMEPADEAEAMLAVQMAATHEVAMEMLARSKRCVMLSQAKAHGALAAKLLRAYAAQVEALARLRRGGVQQVRVVHQHVNVEAGGQAAVAGVVAK